MLSETLQFRIAALDKLILAQLAAHPHDRDELVSTCTAPRTTLYDHLLRLINNKFIIKTPDYNCLRGRPRVMFLLTDAGKALHMALKSLPPQKEAQIGEKRHAEHHL